MVKLVKFGFEKYFYPVYALLSAALGASAVLKNEFDIQQKIGFGLMFGTLAVAHGAIAVSEFKRKIEYDYKDIATAASAIENMERTYL